VTVASRIAELVSTMGEGPVLVHSDPFRAARLVGSVRDRNAFLDAHASLLTEAAGIHALWMPTFNYDFPVTGVFDVTRSESQLGPIPERFRTGAAEWRTAIPMFSVSGTGSSPESEWGPDTDPFGDDSAFAKLVRQDGVVLYYGRTFHYNTIVHYAERLAGGPVYRYDKIFPGEVVLADGKAVSGSLRYHVRPLGTGLDYDWPRLLDEAVAAGICRRLDHLPEVLAASARRLCDLWVCRMRPDPFALLDETSRQWAEPAIAKLGRGFVISDFE